MAVIETARKHLLLRALRESKFAGKMGAAARWISILGVVPKWEWSNPLQERIASPLPGLEEAVLKGSSEVIALFSERLRVLTPFERALIRAAANGVAEQLKRHKVIPSKRAKAVVSPVTEFLNWFAFDYPIYIAHQEPTGQSAVERSGAVSVLSFIDDFDLILGRFQGAAATSRWNSSTSRLRKLLGLDDWSAEPFIPACFQYRRVEGRSETNRMRAALREMAEGLGELFAGIVLSPPEVQAFVRVVVLPLMGYPVDPELASEVAKWGNSKARSIVPLELVDRLSREWTDQEMVQDVDEVMGRSAFVNSAVLHLLAHLEEASVSITHKVPAWIGSQLIMAMFQFRDRNTAEPRGVGAYTQFMWERHLGRPIPNSNFMALEKAAKAPCLDVGAITTDLWSDLGSEWVPQKGISRRARAYFPDNLIGQPKTIWLAWVRSQRGRELIRTRLSAEPYMVSVLAMNILRDGALEHPDGVLDTFVNTHIRRAISALPEDAPQTLEARRLALRTFLAVTDPTRLNIRSGRPKRTVHGHNGQPTRATENLSAQSDGTKVSKKAAPFDPMSRERQSASLVLVKKDRVSATSAVPNPETRTGKGKPRRVDSMNSRNTKSRESHS